MQQENQADGLGLLEQSKKERSGCFRFFAEYIKKHKYNLCISVEYYICQHFDGLWITSESLPEY